MLLAGSNVPLDPLPPVRLLSPNGLLGASAEEIQVDHRKALSIERLGADHADTATGRASSSKVMSRDSKRSTRPLSGGPFDTLTCCPTVGASGNPSEPVSWRHASSVATSLICCTSSDAHRCPAKCKRYRRRLFRNSFHPSAVLSYSACQSASERKPLATSRTRHVPPERASTSHPYATGLPAAPLPMCTNRVGGSHTVTWPREVPMPGPKSSSNAPPARSSTFVGTNHPVMPCPVAIACHTCSGVPETSISCSTVRSLLMRPPAWFPPVG